MLQKLETKHQDLIQQEAELSKKIELLKDLPLEAANYFQDLSEQSLLQMDKRKRKRDVLFRSRWKSKTEYPLCKNEIQNDGTFCPYYRAKIKDDTQIY